jgi:hypothetical protein
MATRQARTLSRTTSFDDATGTITFAPVFRPQPEPGYWIEIATAHVGLPLARLAGRLGPLAGTQSGSESLTAWQEFQELNIGVLRALIDSRPHLMEGVSDDLLERLSSRLREGVPVWHSLHNAATELIRAGHVVLASMDPLVFDAATGKGRVLAFALNEAMKATEICACVVCDTVFTASTRSRQYCSPACRKAAAIAPKEEQQ